MTYRPGAWRDRAITIVSMADVLKQMYGALPVQPIMPLTERFRWRGRRTCPHVLGHRFSVEGYCERCGKARAYASGKMRPVSSGTLERLIRRDTDFGVQG